MPSPGAPSPRARDHSAAGSRRSRLLCGRRGAPLPRRIRSRRSRDRQLEAARDLVNSALEIHLSLVANRQNEVSKQLAIIATIFLPLSYLTGFFGQNFGFMVNGITSKETFFYLGIGSEVAFLIALIAYFRWKKWF
jgi:Mg2+ and Co2+ transporter CorA